MINPGSVRRKRINPKVKPEFVSAPQPSLCAPTLRTRGAVPKHCRLPLLWLDKWWCWRSKQVPDLSYFNAKTRKQTGQVPNLKEQFSQTHFPQEGLMNVGNLSFHLSSSRDGRGQDLWLSKLAVILPLASWHLIRGDAQAWIDSDVWMSKEDPQKSPFVISMWQKTAKRARPRLGWLLEQETSPAL